MANQATVIYQLVMEKANLAEENLALRQRIALLEAELSKRPEPGQANGAPNG